MKNRAALYARYSTDKQSDTSVEDQFRECRRVAEQEDLAVVMTFEDRAISGGTAERPGYQALLNASRAKLFDVIIAEDVSRLWRNRSEFGRATAELEDLGIELVTTAGDDTRGEGWGLVLGIKSAVAEHYRKEVSRKTRRGLHGLALAGRSTGGSCYGYRLEQDGSWIVLGPEAAIVQGIFACRAGGAAPYRIATLLNDDSVPAPRGGTWSAKTVSRILANPKYAGRLVWGAHEVRTSAQNSQRRTRVRRSRPVVSREVPAMRIVDPALWDQVQKMRTGSQK